MSIRKVHCVAAMDVKRGIGKNNDIPWHLPKEYKHFIKVTSSVENSEKQNAVIMGRKTYFSIPEKFRPLKNRLNVVLSGTIAKDLLPGDVLLEPNLRSAIETLSKKPYVDTVESLFVVGGEGVYKEAIESSFCQRIYLTKISGNYSCDTFFPDFDQNLFHEISIGSISTEVQEEKEIKYTFHVFSNEE